MTDQYNFSPAADSGQGSQDVPEGGQPQESKPDYVTRADLEAFKISVIEEARRQAQSLTDRQEGRVEKRLREWTDQLKKDGVNVTPQMVERGREQLALQELTGAAKGKTAMSDPEASDPPDLAVLKQYVARRAEKILKGIGVTVERTDPEFSEIKFITDDPDEYLETLEAAATKKLERLQASPGARAPMSVGGAGTGGDLMSQYRREIMSAPPGSEAALRIRMKYRQKGLNI